MRNAAEGWNMSERYEVRDCPICGGRPSIDQVAAWPRDYGPPPWYAGCYGREPFEHFVGVNGDTSSDARRLWNIEADKIAALQEPKDGTP